MVITFPDGSQRQYPAGTTGADIARSIGEGLARAALGIVVNETIYDLSRPIYEDVTIRILTWKDPEGKQIFWHSTAHLMAEALEALYPGVKFGIGPPIDQGFYYDVDLPEGTVLSSEDFPRIEEKMRELVNADEPYQRIEIEWEDAVAYFRQKGDEYKLELLDELRGQPITFYRQGNFTDLCRGTHVKRKGRVGQEFSHETFLNARGL
jgi:threonyl-tRNA synthetase